MCVKVVGCLGGRWDSVGTMVHLIRVSIVVPSPPLSSPLLPSPPLPSPPFPCLVVRYVHYQLVMTASLTTGMNFEAIHTIQFVLQGLCALLCAEYLCCEVECPVCVGCARLAPCVEGEWSGRFSTAVQGAPHHMRWLWPLRGPAATCAVAAYS